MMSVLIKDSKVMSHTKFWVFHFQVARTHSLTHSLTHTHTHTHTHSLPIFGGSYESPSSISGAEYSSDPHDDSINSPGRKVLDRPKSVSLTLSPNPAGSPEAVPVQKTRFSGFKSL